MAITQKEWLNNIRIGKLDPYFSSFWNFGVTGSDLSFALALDAFLLEKS